MPAKKAGSSSSRAEAGVFVDDTKLGDVAKWVATGFALLGGIAAFFGIKDGRLEQVLRADEGSALAVFGFVGFAVLVGVVVVLFKPEQRRPLWGAVVVIAAMFVVTAEVFPDIGLDDDGVGPAVTYSIFAALIVIAFVLRLTQASVPIVVSVLLVGIFSLTCGLYGAVKISVVSTSYPERASVVVAGIEGDGEARELSLKVRGGNLEPEDYLIVRVKSGDEVVGSAHLVPDGAGDIAADILIPIRDPEISKVNITVQECNDLLTGELECLKEYQRATLDLRIPVTTTTT